MINVYLLCKPKKIILAFKPLFCTANIHQQSRKFVCSKKRLKGYIKDLLYTKVNPTQIWYGEFNQYAYKANLPPRTQHEFQP